MTLIEQTQESVRRRGFFNYHSKFSATQPKSVTQLCKLLEEVGELAGALFSDDMDAAKSELADVYVTVCSLAYQMGVDLEEEVKKKIDKDDERGHLHGK